MNIFKNIEKLNLGYSDSEDYKVRENKGLLQEYFYFNSHMEKLMRSTTCFVIGEKGTGKTAYATYLSNNVYNNTIGCTKFIRETHYLEFLALKKSGIISISDYQRIWELLILFLLSGAIIEKFPSNVLEKHLKFRKLKSALDSYFGSAFAPEISNGLTIVREETGSFQAAFRDNEISGQKGYSTEKTEQGFQIKITSLIREFKDAISELKLDKNVLLFIDGIDIRPHHVPFDDYLDCIKGLANATWALNMDFFANIKARKGRFRSLMLVRPDIFNSIGLQNQNSKVDSNSVNLNWVTNYYNHRASDLFALIDQMLRSQQANKIELKLGDAWDFYFPFQAKNVEYSRSELENTSFVELLRLSYYRPRDILKLMHILKEKTLALDKNAKVFESEILRGSDLLRDYSNYLLGEIKDQMCFYYSAEEYEHFLSFFTFLKGSSRLDYSSYLQAFQSFAEAHNNLPKFAKSANTFLQFLYDLNVIGYKETTEDGKSQFHWCFRDRTPANISPKVKIGVDYIIFKGLQKALDLGSHLTR